MEDCTLCPRNCHVNRRDGQKGVCRETAEIVIARAALHMWEEPCISGKAGSGTVFFSGCPVGCVFCQNAAIADGECGKKITPGRLRNIFLELQEKGANNINLVTPTHFVPQIIWAVNQARKKGLCIPIVYNTSGYEKKETIQQLEGIVDIYLPDMKYMDNELSKKYSHAEDYFIYASQALAEMVRQIPEAVFDERGIMQKGVIVRHLLLPGQLRDSKHLVKYLYKTYRNTIYISMMNQYTPMPWLQAYPELQHKVKKKEYDALIDYAIQLGIENGFIQEGKTASESFIPKFDNEGVSSEVVVMNFSHIYEQERFYKQGSYRWIDCTDIRGTDCYCDEEAGNAIMDKIKNCSPYGIHFIDSGNYHYVSKLWLDKVKEPFVLLVLDHHPDMQPSLFGSLMSCGCWVKAVLDKNPYIQKVVLLGAKEELIENIDEIYRNRMVCYNEESMNHIETWRIFAKKHVKEPVYTSIDKDVLDTDSAVTNWDQGSMSLKELEALVRIICKQEQIIGVDICGECANTLQSWTDYKSNLLNDRTNYGLMELFERLIYASNEPNANREGRTDDI